MAPPRFRAQKRPSALSQTVRGTTQCLFALALLLIFGTAILVGTGAINMPQWAKSLDQFSEGDRPLRAGALLGCVCLVFFLFIAAGILQMRRESRGGQPDFESQRS